MSSLGSLRSLGCICKIYISISIRCTYNREDVVGSLGSLGSGGCIYNISIFLIYIEKNGNMQLIFCICNISIFIIYIEKNGHMHVEVYIFARCDKNSHLLS